MFRAAAATILVLVLCPPSLAQPVAVPSESHAVLTPTTAPMSAGADDISVGGLFRRLGTDFKRLPSWESAWILGIGGGLSAAVVEQDPQVTRRFVRSEGLDTFFEPGEVAGGGLLQVGLAVGVYGWGRQSGHRHVAQLGSDLVRSQILTAALTQGVKFAVGRERPDGTRYSFPSGHTSATFATAAVLHRHFGWRIGIPAYGAATFVGGSRLQENRHYLSDVIFGAAIGIVAGRTATIGRGEATFAVVPVAAPGGGGIGLTLVGQR